MSILPLPHSRSSNPEALPRGSIRPRIYTRPLRRLSPTTSYGYRVIWFAAEVLGMPLDPWQQWLVIHIGELLADGRPRFRQALVLVARQNGKTHLCVVLTLYWMFVERWPMIFGTSTNLEQAAEPWEAAVELAEGTKALSDALPRNAVRRANGQQVLRNTYRSKYKIGAVNEKGGRGKSIDRLIGDELRTHKNYVGYNAAYNAMNARPYAQAVFISNQGDDTAVVLNDLYEGALDFITTGAGDDRLGLFEYSGPPGCRLDDVDALAQANPNVGWRNDWDTLLGPARRLSLPGAPAAAVAGFRTEILCQRVANLDPALNAARWNDSKVEGDLSGLRSRLAACVDVSPDMQHATLVVAGLMPDDRIRVEIPGVGAVVGAWSGPTAVADMQRQLPAMIRKIRPQVLGWLPGGPAAAAAAGLKDRKGPRGTGTWPPPGITVAEISSEVSAVCMGLAVEVQALGVVHAGDPLLDDQVTGATKLYLPGDRWRFDRAGDGHVDAVYAMAGAVHLARTLPAPVGKPRIIVSTKAQAARRRR